ncbi:MAG: S-layer homology domain-containing protein [Candidatus Peribacteraceae bacterium]|nr:S-layer homology domain-containing protein [Candidatus Peribacteraceae bacterium]
MALFPFTLMYFVFCCGLISGFLAIAAPVPVHAASMDDFRSDVELFKNEVETSLQESTDQVLDRAAEQSKNLFPDRSGEVGTGASKRMLEEDPAFLTVRVEDVPVVLRDVPKGEWFAPYVRDTAARGILVGYRDEMGLPTGKFGSADNLTIEQLAKIAVVVAGIDTSACVGSGTLKNSSAVDRWSTPYILCAETNGWAVFSDGSVPVRKLASRSEVVVTLLQAFFIPVSGETSQRFSDVGASTEFAAAIERAAQDGIITGYTDVQGNPTAMFGPADPVLRAEMAKIVSLALQLYGED